MDSKTHIDNSFMNQPKNESVNTTQPKSKNFVFTLLYVLLFVFIIIAGIFLYQKQKLEKSIASNKSNTVLNLPPGWQRYISPEKDYEFYYPPNWEILTEVPDEFMYINMFNDLKGQEGVDWFNTEEGKEKWLNGKMFTKKTCRGPILQNREDTTQLIAFDINKNNNKELPCYSAGWSFETNKWKVSNKYPYPVSKDNLDNLLEVDWIGDYRIIKSVSSNQGFKASSALVNRETFEIRGETDFDQIIQTFKILK